MSPAQLELCILTPQLKFWLWAQIQAQGTARGPAASSLGPPACAARPGLGGFFGITPPARCMGKRLGVIKPRRPQKTRAKGAAF